MHPGATQEFLNQHPVAGVGAVLLQTVLPGVQLVAFGGRASSALLGVNLGAELLGRAVSRHRALKPGYCPLTCAVRVKYAVDDKELVTM